MSNFDETLARIVRAQLDANAVDEDTPMPNIFDEDDETFQTVVVDGRKTRVLKDGAKLHTRMMMMDGGAEILQNTARYVRQQATQKAQKAAMDAAVSTSKEVPMTKYSFSDADARKFGLKDGGIALHRPGFRFNGVDPYAKDASILAFADYDADAASAWKTPTPLPYTTEVVGAGSKGPDLSGEGVEGDSCMDGGGHRGTLRRIDGKLVCVPDGAQDGLSARDMARIEYEDSLCNAWKAGRSAPETHVDAAPTVKDAATIDHYDEYDNNLRNAWRR